MARPRRPRHPPARARGARNRSAFIVGTEHLNVAARIEIVSSPSRKKRFVRRWTGSGQTTSARWCWRQRFFSSSVRCWSFSMPPGSASVSARCKMCRRRTIRSRQAKRREIAEAMEQLQAPSQWTTSGRLRSLRAGKTFHRRQRRSRRHCRIRFSIHPCLTNGWRNSVSRSPKPMF